MTETINTCSRAISFAKELEDAAAAFYRDLSEKFDTGRDIFLTFARENGTFFTQIQRAYYGVISDAIEGCFAFNINPEHYELKTTLADNATYADALRSAMAIEEKIVAFYTLAAEQSGSLMADVPRAFKKVIKKRNTRLATLSDLGNSSQSTTT